MASLRQLRVTVTFSRPISSFFRVQRGPVAYNARRFLSATPARRDSENLAPPTTIFRDVEPLREFRRAALLDNRTIGLVPTMGALHEGHLSLVRHAAAENTDVFVTIYVNPTQFGLNEDLASYPKTWETDLRMLHALDRELASVEGAGRTAAYQGVGSFIEMRPLGQLLEGASRPVFFRGVATVCMKLFNICQPERVYFGQKDIQQTVVIRRLVKDFHLPIDVKIVPTSREPDGLALSSRNVYLGARRRTVGIVLNQALRKAEAQYKAGKRGRGDILWPASDHADQTKMTQDALEPHRRARFEVDYISLADPETMEELDEVDPARGAILSGAVKMLPIEEAGSSEDLGVGGGQIPVRLIDNVVLDPAS
ncbi:pantoate-beta-alanine ligase [Didymosphaeria variabile]|uniref:Pantoate--beta-alanine ligase n=1 Tax=Didymosphaeria variabile TaxID=1932322 RepID=A0A9W8XHW1_9PLEO|nr:pantoate-beta-alanine ligase [Didymosphaeria variabile]KAJ4351540.1 pantoate-beta-alanine ligase [Didymosphaeria variabile]